MSFVQYNYLYIDRVGYLVTDREAKNVQSHTIHLVTDREAKDVQSHTIQ